MKKVFYVAGMIALSLSLTACGEDKKEESKLPTVTEQAKAQAAESEKGGVTFNSLYITPSFPGQKVGAAYFTLINNNTKDVKVTDVSSSVSETTEFHYMEMKDNKMIMRKMNDVIIPSNGSLVLRQGGDHLMFIGLEKSLEPSDPVSVHIVFDNGETLDINGEVSTTAAMSDGYDHSGHDHSGHDHSDHDHSGYDHDAHDHDAHDHDAHDHDAHDHDAHDHDAHDHDAHDHDAHDHDAHDHDAHDHDAHDHDAHDHDAHDHDAHDHDAHDHDAHDHDAHDHDAHDHDAHDHDAHDHDAHDHEAHDHDAHDHDAHDHDAHDHDAHDHDAHDHDAHDHDAHDHDAHDHDAHDHEDKAQ